MIYSSFWLDYPECFRIAKSLSEIPLHLNWADSLVKLTDNPIFLINCESFARSASDFHFEKQTCQKSENLIF